MSKSDKLDTDLWLTRRQYVSAGEPNLLVEDERRKSQQGQKYLKL